MSRVDEVSQQIMRLLEREETVHLRTLLQRLPYGLREIKRALAKLEAEGAVESFTHGGYTFYRLAGRGEEEEEMEADWSWREPSGGESPSPETGVQRSAETEGDGRREGSDEAASAPEETGQ